MIVQRLSGLNRVVVGSVSVLTVFMLIVLDVALSVSNPLKFLNSTGLAGPNQYFITDKLPEFLASGLSPEVIMTGSSLFLFPAVRCDDEFCRRRTRYDKEYLHNHVACYSKALYLEGELCRRAGKPLSVANLATLGELISDQYLVFKKCISSLKKPAVLVCDISPRAFLDNNLPDPRLTPVYLALQDQVCLGDLLETHADSAQISQLMLGRAWHFFQLRGNYRDFCNQLVARLSNHPSNLYFAMHPQLPAADKNVGAPKPLGAAAPEKSHKPIFDAPDNTLGDLEAYRRDYQPLTMSHFKVQSIYLKKLLALARDQHVAVLLVDMPLMPQNTELLPPAFLKQYEIELAMQAKAYDAVLIRPALSESFASSDFEDSAHLNASGGRKLYKAISAEVAALLFRPGKTTGIAAGKGSCP